MDHECEPFRSVISCRVSYLQDGSDCTTQLSCTVLASSASKVQDVDRTRRDVSRSQSTFDQPVKRALRYVMPAFRQGPLVDPYLDFEPCTSLATLWLLLP